VRALGKSDAAYMTVVPLWARYMYEAARTYPNPAIPWLVPPGVKADDRGDHSKGQHGPQMELLFRPPPKKTDDTGRPPVRSHEVAAQAAGDHRAPGVALLDLGEAAAQRAPARLVPKAAITAAIDDDDHAAVAYHARPAADRGFPVGGDREVRADDRGERGRRNGFEISDRLG